MWLNNKITSLDFKGLGKIVYPGYAVTSIVKAGESFEVWFNARSRQVVKSAELHGPYNTVVIQSINSEIGSWEYDSISKNTYNTRITISIPEDTPADCYDLVLNTSSGQIVSISAVNVIKEYKTNYKILHIADSHLGQQTNPEGLIEAKHTAIIKLINIINPDLVFVCGDNIHDNVELQDYQSQFTTFFEGVPSQGIKGLHDIHAPTFVVCGNHDKIGNCSTDSYALKSHLWNEYWGLQCHVFKYGNSRFMLFNNGWDDYDWEWQKIYCRHWLNEEGSGGKLRVAIAHNNRPENMNPFAINNNLGLYLIGHYHHRGAHNPWPIDMEEDQSANNPQIMYIVNSMREYLEFTLFQVDDNTGEYNPLGYTNTGDVEDRLPNYGYGLSTGSNKVLENGCEKDKFNMSAWIYNLILDYAYDNDGTSSYNTASIVNKFNYTIPDARVRFVMPKKADYDISRGIVVQTFDGDDFHIIDVNVDVEANSTTKLEIYCVDR